MTAWTLGAGIGFSMRKLANSYLSLQENLASVDRLCGILCKQTVEYGEKSEKTIENTGIVFSDVTFAYNENSIPLQHFSCEIPAEKMTAIVGPSGAGKSTLVYLLLRLYDPDVGSISIGNVNLRDFSADALRRLITYVPQSPMLFSGTLRDNLTLHKPDAGNDEIWNVIKQVHMDRYIMAIPEGIDAEVGENGALLSGGERQRIALASAFLNDSPILILDEPTSGLDETNKRIVLEQIKTLRKTIIVITHDTDIAQEAQFVLYKSH